MSKQAEGNGNNREAFLSRVKNLKVIALDCDGVLFDSRDANIRFYSHILETIGLSAVREDQHDYIHMHPVRQSLLYLIGGEGELFEKAFAYFKTIDFGPFNEYLHKEPGLIAFLELAKKNFRTALATNRTASTLELLEQYDLSKYFDLVVSASDVANPKPHPDIMLRVLDTFGVAPDEVLYIGDSVVDEGLARATGVPFVGYKNPALRADIHIGHFEELHCLFP